MLVPLQPPFTEVFPATFDYQAQIGDNLNQYSYGHLLVITGYKWDYTFYKWGYKYL